MQIFSNKPFYLLIISHKQLTTDFTFYVNIDIIVLVSLTVSIININTNKYKYFRKDKNQSKKL